jgi:hypothetical protein
MAGMRGELLMPVKGLEGLLSSAKADLVVGAYLRMQNATSCVQSIP